MRRNLWTFLSFTIHCLKHSLELFLAEFSMLNNKYLKFGGGRFGCTGIIWDMNIKQENGHGPLTFSALWHQTQSISLTLVTTPRICIGAAPGVHAQNATGAGTRGLLWSLDTKPPQAHALGWYPGKPSVPVWVWEVDRVSTSLRSSEAFFWTVSSSIFPSSYIKCIRYLEKEGSKASY